MEGGTAFWGDSRVFFSGAFFLFGVKIFAAATSYGCVFFSQKNKKDTRGMRKTGLYSESTAL